MKTASAALLLCWLFTSCEKQYIDIIPVLQIEQDISIAGAGDIKFFTFPTEQVGYAATEKAIVYKTTDGGITWKKLATPFSASCKGLEFYDLQNGMCLINQSVYVTENGGLTWVLRDSSPFMGITKEGVGVIGKECGYNVYCIYTSTNKGKSFQQIGKVTLDGDLAFAKVTGSKVYLVPTNVMDEEIFYGLDLKTKQTEKVAVYSIGYDSAPNDIFVDEQQGYIVGKGGLIMERQADFTTTASLYHQVNGYFGQDNLSVDAYNNLAVGVGERTISVNIDFGKDGTWTELLSPAAKSFEPTFYKVKFAGENKFYISGSNGLLWKAKI
ncbi:hypothetical protein GU926_11940 [Nibribacter ruber]|uniref:Photosynthesis system II assembly factor Ycf48/Hcf136-like domain-containing protein n=1 Tax=Nibribacter ruber TaxID=2698458 RepID=A0A6P1P1R4_9BACT|nr:hypothetical protein [Nibribacter ruber]QHL88103.1 hypothetical protein GU926_11940 [Nibribacter ruber]